MANMLVGRAGADPRPAPTTEEPAVGPVHRLVAATLAGAALIHAAMAPSHLEETAVEGWGFVLAAWAQLGLAIVILLRPARRVLVTVAAVSAGLIGAWVVSRTAGLPFGDHAGHAESVSLVDGAAVGLEAVALV